MGKRSTKVRLRAMWKVLTARRFVLVQRNPYKKTTHAFFWEVEPHFLDEAVSLIELYHGMEEAKQGADSILAEATK